MKNEGMVEIRKHKVVSIPTEKLLRDLDVDPTKYAVQSVTGTTGVFHDDPRAISNHIVEITLVEVPEHLRRKRD